VANQRNKRSRVKPSDARNRLRRGRPKVCLVCSERIDFVDYKNTAFLRRFMSDRGKIKSRANTGTCVQHQHEVALAIKNAREVALLPYAVRTMAADKGGGRRGRGAPGGGGGGGGRSGDRPGPGRFGRGPATAEAGAEGGAEGDLAGSDDDFEGGSDIDSATSDNDLGESSARDAFGDETGAAVGAGGGAQSDDAFDEG
jgi:small subunit ribosomal protein S18